MANEVVNVNLDDVLEAREVGLVPGVLVSGFGDGVALRFSSKDELWFIADALLKIAEDENEGCTVAFGREAYESALAEGVA